MAGVTGEVRDAVVAFLRRAQRDLRVDRAYLFGSWARGTAGPWSDIDLAIFSRDLAERPFLEAQRLLYSYTWETSAKIEPVGLPPSALASAGPADLVGGVIVREGILVCEDDRILV
jgi:nucleotidyltransferase-like protein